MLLTNPDKILNSIKVHHRIGIWLIENGIPLLGIKDNFYYFSDTEAFREKLKKLPLIMRVLYKGGMIEK